MTDEGYQFDDDVLSTDPALAVSNGGQKPARTGFAQEVFSKTIQAKFRTFYVDLKKSSNGFFVKVSEKSHGRKSTIMMDMEDVNPMIQALQELMNHAK